MGKHGGDAKKDKPFIPAKPDGGDKSGGGDGKHSGAKGGKDGQK